MRFVYIRTYYPFYPDTYYLVSIEGGTWEEYKGNLRCFELKHYERPYDSAYTYAMELHKKYNLSIKIPSEYDPNTLN